MPRIASMSLAGITLAALLLVTPTVGAAVFPRCCPSRAQCHNRRGRRKGSVIRTGSGWVVRTGSGMVAAATAGGAPGYPDTPSTLLPGGGVWTVRCIE